jgi:leucyl aminopeptidase (aminopeptidase T)
VASLPGITVSLMTDGSMTVDYERLSARSWALNQLLETAHQAEVTTPAGTRLALSLAGREPQTPPDDGLYRQPGAFGNLPAGEAYIAPVEGSADGIVVVDGSMAPLGLVQTPIRLTVRQGRVVQISGGAQATRLEELLGDINHAGAWMVGELGIGTNDHARLTGNVLEDEKVMGTVHVGLGRNVDFGGTVDSPAQHDGVLRAPTLILDGQTVIQEGRFLLQDP